jgi:hypothetical protein
MEDLAPPPVNNSGNAFSKITGFLWKDRSTKGRIGILLGAVVILALVTGPLSSADESADGPETTIGSSNTTPAEAPTSAPAAQASTTTQAATPTAAPTTTISETVSQRNARSSAESYLRFSAFSRSGLIGQLEYEQFSTADATYAVDALDVDWREQAAKSAQQYLDFSSFSRGGLIDQLIFEGFSRAEAEFGVDAVGL